RGRSRRQRGGARAGPRRRARGLRRAGADRRAARHARAHAAACGLAAVVRRERSRRTAAVGEHADEIVYTAESSLRHPGRLAREMLGAVRASRSLAWQLALRNPRAPSRQSVLGVAWAFTPPIVLAAGFTLANRANVIRVGATDIPY